MKWQNNFWKCNLILFFDLFDHARMPKVGNTGCISISFISSKAEYKRCSVLFISSISRIHVILLLHVAKMNSVTFPLKLFLVYRRYWVLSKWPKYVQKVSSIYLYNIFLFRHRNLTYPKIEEWGWTSTSLSKNKMNWMNFFLFVCLHVNLS